MWAVCVQRTELLLPSRPLYEGKLFRDLFFQVLLYLAIIWIVATFFTIGLCSSRPWPKLRGKLN
jgi:hypothetical protein